jgi:hypothetical protein
MAEVTELESVPTKETLGVLNKILAVAESMTAFAPAPYQLHLMEANVADMRADRDKYEERLERLEGSNEQLKKADWDCKIGGSVVDLEGTPNKEGLVALDNILGVAQSIPALAESPELRQLLKAKVAAMQADRDNYATRLERLESRNK